VQSERRVLTKEWWRPRKLTSDEKRNRSEREKRGPSRRRELWDFIQQGEWDEVREGIPLKNTRGQKNHNENGTEKKLLGREVVKDLHPQEKRSLRRRLRRHRIHRKKKTCKEGERGGASSPSSTFERKRRNKCGREKSLEQDQEKGGFTNLGTLKNKGAKGNRLATERGPPRILRIPFRGWPEKGRGKKPNLHTMCQGPLPIKRFQKRNV